MSVVMAITGLLLLLMSLVSIYGLFSVANIIFGTCFNCKNGCKFSWKRLWSGVGKASILLLAVCLTMMGSALIPIVGEELARATGVQLIDKTIIDTISTVGVYSSVIAGIVIQAVKAIANCGRLFKITVNKQGEIVIPEEESDDNNKPSI